MKHIKFDCLYGMLDGQTCPGFPQDVMRQLGIKYIHATPQTIGDQWWFWGCHNIPNPLPPYLEVLDVDPWECVGFGLTKEMAKKLRDYENQIELIKYCALKLREVVIAAEGMEHQFISLALAEHGFIEANTCLGSECRIVDRGWYETGDDSPGWMFEDGTLMPEYWKVVDIIRLDKFSRPVRAVAVKYNMQ
jgi:hypothetical protein